MRYLRIQTIIANKRVCNFRNGEVGYFIRVIRSRKCILEGLHVNTYVPLYC
jgi:hypothetical protein